jgi:Zn-dependent peptidase ImmA (M78 family)
VKTIVEIQVNHNVLKWARETLALNKASAAKIISCTIERLDKLETGEKKPTLDELKKMASAYKRTIATLLLNKPPEEKPLPADRRSVDSKDIGKFNEKTIMAVRKARALCQSLIELKRDAGIAITKFGFRATMQQNPKLVAKTMRTKWGLADIQAIENNNDFLDACIEMVESLGIAVFQLALTQDKLRGFALIDEAIPIIGIKRGGELPTAKVFTLFHEIGHILLNEGGLCDLSDNTKFEIEKWCNAFAAEMLVPAADLSKMDVVLSRQKNGSLIWPQKELILLSAHFHVGPLAVLRSLLELNLTTQEYYNNRHTAWSKPTFGRAKKPEGRNIAKETIKEKGRTYIMLAFKAYDQNRINLKDLSDFLGVKLSYIPKTRQQLNA